LVFGVQSKAKATGVNALDEAVPVADSVAQPFRTTAAARASAPADTLDENVLVSRDSCTVVPSWIVEKTGHGM
jgi:hypothetical protein